jgi:hypothetical protein
MNWCLYRLKPHIAIEVSRPPESPIIGLVDVPDTKTAGVILDTLVLGGHIIESDMFLEEEPNWSASLRNQWDSVPKMTWKRLLAKAGMRTRTSGSG